MQFLPSVILSLSTGRLYTNIDDIYRSLNYLTGSSVMTHDIPNTMRFVMSIIKPLIPEQLWSENWIHNDETFLKDVAALDANMELIELSPITEEQMQGFDQYIIENSPLNRR